MCGIALIVSGVRIDLSSLLPNFVPPAPQVNEQPLFTEEDIKAALRRRGPDSLGARDVFLYPKIVSLGYEQEIPFSVEGEKATSRNTPSCNGTYNCIPQTNGEPCMAEGAFVNEPLMKLHFVGATLQLRGISPVVQPLVDAHGNVLIYNGEIFGGIHVSSDGNDAEVLMKTLGCCCSCTSHEHARGCYSCKTGQSSVPELLSKIKGPWALVYWQDCSKTLWFGRDAFGRRSLLVHWPTSKDIRLVLSSVSPPTSIHESSGFGGQGESDEQIFWEELECGVYSVSMITSKNGNLVGQVKKHEWKDCLLKELIKWERIFVEPKPKDIHISRMKVAKEKQIIISDPSVGILKAAVSVRSEAVLIAMRESVMRRTSLNSIYKDVITGSGEDYCAPVAVLFSGGLDSMIIAALLHQCLDIKYVIDLLNVSFDGLSAPDRISARAGIKELKRIAPSRRWNLVEIDADLLKLASEMKHVMSLINPAQTYMDLNIGLALWLAAGGDGWLYEELSNNNSVECLRVKYKSMSRILLIGSGADEQCAGYGRHKTKYRQGSWLQLHDEMKLDMQRIWKRNLGRDDRCIADNGKEARFPFLDEDVIKTLLDIPLWEICDLDQPSGLGDKKILREVAQLLGLYEVAVLPKRAIQFGSRIARESNKKNFGSNRAANQASAGSAVICGSSILS